MAYLEDGYFKIGAVESPLTSSTANSLLQDADPALYQMLLYYQGIFDLHIIPRWNTEIARAGLSGLDGYLPNELLPYDPWRTGLGPQNTWRAPLLAIYPVSSTYKFLTVPWFELHRQMELLFSLPPLSSEQYEYLHPFLQFVERVIVDRTLSGFDSNYNNGQLVWSDAGIEKITVNNSSYGNIAAKTNLHFPTLTMSITVIERRMPDSRNFENLESINYKVDSVVDGYAAFNIVDGYVSGL